MKIIEIKRKKRRSIRSWHEVLLQFKNFKIIYPYINTPVGNIKLWNNKTQKY